MRSTNNRYLQYLQKVFIYLSKTILFPSKQAPSDIINISKRFFQSTKHLWNMLFGIANSSCFDFSFISSTVAKCFQFFGVFSFGKRKNSARAKSVEYGGWVMITVFFSWAVWADAISWCKIHDWFFHNSVRFWLIASYNWLMASI